MSCYLQMYYVIFVARPAPMRVIRYRSMTLVSGGEGLYLYYHTLETTHDRHSPIIATLTRSVFNKLVVMHKTSRLLSAQQWVAQTARSRSPKKGFIIGAGCILAVRAKPRRTTVTPRFNLVGARKIHKDHLHFNGRSRSPGKDSYIN